MEVAITEIKDVVIIGEAGEFVRSAIVVSKRNIMNPTFARPIKKPESRKYDFFARRMK